MGGLGAGMRVSRVELRMRISREELLSGVPSAGHHVPAAIPEPVTPEMVLPPGHGLSPPQMVLPPGRGHSLRPASTVTPDAAPPAEGCTPTEPLSSDGDALRTAPAPGVPSAGQRVAGTSDCSDKGRLLF